MAPLQRRAFYGLLIGFMWIVAIVVVFILKGGVSAFDEDQGFRLIIDGLWIGGLVVYLILYKTILHEPDHVDERDKLILDNSPRFQWWAVIFTLVAWVIALSESYHNEGQVPVVFLYLIFMSVLIVSMIGQAIGILIGYRRMR